jgi:hypothetical protein
MTRIGYAKPQVFITLEALETATRQPFLHSHLLFSSKLQPTSRLNLRPDRSGTGISLGSLPFSAIIAERD